MVANIAPDARGAPPPRSASPRPSSWSAHGRFMLYNSVDPLTHGDLWIVPMVGDRTPSAFLRTPFSEAWGVFSPDGRWVAYQSDESGRSEIHVRPPSHPGHVADWRSSAVAGVYLRRQLSRMAPRRQGAVLPGPIGRNDGGAGLGRRLRLRVRRDGAALSYTRAQCTGRGCRAPLRRRPGRTLSCDHVT